MKIGAGQNSIMKKVLLCTILISLAFLNCSQQKNLEQYVLRGGTMGTSYNVKIVVPGNAAVNSNDLHSDIKLLLARANNIASTYIDDSELSIFNQYTAGEWLKVSNELVDIVEASLKVSTLSNGAFDITVGPLVNLWGFGPEHNLDDIPTAEDIQHRKELVGFENIVVRKDPPALKKKFENLYCDLSAIAKGWGVDQVADLLENKDFHNYLVEIGGEIRAKGFNAKGRKWRIGVSSPKESNEIEKVIKVTNVGVATSGDYRNYFEKGGVRYSHTIDPRTGAPIQHELASVTVIHPSCMLADAFATAIDVLGPIDGLTLAIENDLTVLMIIKIQDGFVEKMTPSFEKYVQK
jgi:FAD:protein FMN transferase